MTSVRVIARTPYANTGMTESAKTQPSLFAYGAPSCCRAPSHFVSCAIVLSRHRVLCHRVLCREPYARLFLARIDCGDDFLQQHVFGGCSLKRIVIGLIEHSLWYAVHIELVGPLRKFRRLYHVAHHMG